MPSLFRMYCSSKSCLHAGHFSSSQREAFLRTPSNLLLRRIGKEHWRVPKRRHILCASRIGNEVKQEPGTNAGEAPEQSGGSSGASYVPLVVSYASLGLLTTAFPERAADLLFGVKAEGHDALVPLLIRLVAAGFACAGCTSFMLKGALEDAPVSQSIFERLNLGLFVFATLNTLLLVTSLVSPTGSVQYPARVGFWAVAIIYLLTLTVSWGSYSGRADIQKTVDKISPGPALKRLKRDVESVVARPTENTLAKAYTGITLALVPWGMAQLFVPQETLSLLVHSQGGDESMLLVRLLGAATISLSSIATYSLKDMAVDSNVKPSSATALRAGLALMSLAHIVSLLPYALQGSKSGPILGVFVASSIGMLTVVASSGSKVQNER